MEWLWILSFLIVAFTLLLVFILKYNNIHCSHGVIMLAGAIGIAGFTFAILCDRFEF